MLDLSFNQITASDTQTPQGDMKGNIPENHSPVQSEAVEAQYKDRIKYVDKHKVRKVPHKGFCMGKHGLVDDFEDNKAQPKQKKINSSNK